MKKTKQSLVRLMFLLTVSSIVFSCSKNEQIIETTATNLELSTIPKLENGMLVFPDHPSFESFLSKVESGQNADIPKFNSLFAAITEANKSEEQQQEGRLNDLIDFDFPVSYQKVLNKEGKVKIGGELILYTQGRKYFIPSKYTNLTSVDALEAAGVKSLAVGKNIIGIQLDKTANLLRTSNISNLQGGGRIMEANNRISSVDIGVNSIDARYQHEFYANGPSAGCRKYVHELFTFLDGYDMGGVLVYTGYAYLRIKLEWKTCSRSKWNLASETRNISYAISGSAEAINFSFGGYDPGPFFNLNTTTTGSGIVSVLLAKRGASGTMINPYWRISMSGSISQHIIGDSPSNLWTNTGYPLW